VQLEGLKNPPYPGLEPATFGDLPVCSIVPKPTYTYDKEWLQETYTFLSDSAVTISMEQINDVISLTCFESSMTHRKPKSFVIPYRITRRACTRLRLRLRQ
jgi:hypothetical protein